MLPSKINLILPPILGYWVLTDLDPSVNPWLKSYNAPSGMNSMVMFEHESKLFWITTSNTAINFQLLDVVSYLNCAFNVY